MKDEQVYLLHIRDAIDRILNYPYKKGRNAFLGDQMTQDAVLRNMEIFGEASKRVSEPLREPAPDVPWRQMARMRDKLIHDYFSVDFHLVWEVVASEPPGARERVLALLDELENESRSSD